MRRRVVLVVVLVAAVAAIFWYLERGPVEAPDRLLASGTVEATDAQLGFQTTGRIERIEPREGDEVAEGEVLAELERRETEARRREAQAMVKAAAARRAELEAGFRPEEVAQARAGVQEARERLADADRDVERSRMLFEGGAVSREVLDKARVGREVASSRLVQAEERLRLLERGPRQEEIDAQRSRVAQAEATLAAVEAALDKMTLTAPFSGVVTVRHREPGEIVAPGAPVLTLLDRADRWVRIYIPEDRMGAVELGATASIGSDTFPAKAYPGEVVFIASEAEFTPKNVQTREERVRLVYAVKVRVVDDPGYELKPGMPVDVEVHLPASAGSR